MENLNSKLKIKNEKCGVRPVRFRDRAHRAVNVTPRDISIG